MTDDATTFLHTTMPFNGTLGFRPGAMTPELVEISVDWAPELCTAAGMAHGGLIMSLADSAGGSCAFLNLPKGGVGTSTIESKTNFLGAVREGTVRAISRPLHTGSTTIVVETELRRSDGKLVGKTTQTQSVLRPKS